MAKLRYESRELEGESKEIVRKYNTLPIKKHIFGVFDTDRNCFVEGDKLSLTYYFWTCSRGFAERCAKTLNQNG